MVTNAAPLARQLANWCATVRWAELPSAVRSAVPLRVLDTVGLAIAGAQTDAGRIIRAQALTMRGAGEASLIGTKERVPAAQAALALGVQAHCRDFDDTFMDSVVHPGSVVLPTALALAEARESSADDFGAAIVVGYEVCARLGGVAGRRFHAHHFHATGVVGPIAAAATAGRLLGLPGEQIAWAMGLAASMSGGLMAFIADGGWSKWLHAGWSAHGGVLAAELAAQGFHGPQHVLDGGHDLYSALLYGEEIDRSTVTAQLGVRWAGAAAQFKYYPCAHVIQPYIDAVLALRAEHGLAAHEIERITCGIAPWAAAIVAEPRDAKLRFTTELEAIASLPYQLAVAIIEDGVDLGALAAASRARADYAQLAARIFHRNDPTLGQGFDGDIEIVTTRGESFKRAATTSGVDPNKLVAKFTKLVAPIAGADATTHIARDILATSDWRAASAAFNSGSTS